MIEHTTPDQIHSAFAEITAQLEDMTTVAARGQCSQLKPDQALEVCATLRLILGNILQQIKNIERDLT